MIGRIQRAGLRDVRSHAVLDFTKACAEAMDRRAEIMGEECIEAGALEALWGM